MGYWNEHAPGTPTGPEPRRGGWLVYIALIAGLLLLAYVARLLFPPS